MVIFFFSVDTGARKQREIDERDEWRKAAANAHFMDHEQQKNVEWLCGTILPIKNKEKIKPAGPKPMLTVPGLNCALLSTGAIFTGSWRLKTGKKVCVSNRQLVTGNAMDIFK